MLEKLGNKKLLICFVALAIVAVVGMVVLLTITGVPGQDVYSGVNVEKVVDLGEYKGLTLQIADGTSESVIRSNLLSKVVIDSEVEKFPAKVIKKYVKENREYYEGIAADYGYDSLELYVTEQFQYTLEDFEMYIEEYSKSKAKSEMVILAIAKAEGLEVTDAEVKTYCDGILQQEGYTEETFAQVYGMSMADYAEEQDFQFNLLQDKVLTLLQDNATVEYV